LLFKFEHEVWSLVEEDLSSV